MELHERTLLLEERLRKADRSVQKAYRHALTLSWISHDNSMEGVVYPLEDLNNALSDLEAKGEDAITQASYLAIRRHSEALDFVRQYAAKAHAPVNLSTLHTLHRILHPQASEAKILYRKDIPQHRLYLHDYAPPSTIPDRLDQIFESLQNTRELAKESPVETATRIHYEVLRVFPFQHDSGKVARLLMNLYLLRYGYSPAIFHPSERQRYYEALKGTFPSLYTLVCETLDNSLDSIEKFLDVHENASHPAELSSLSTMPSSSLA